MVSVNVILDSKKKHSNNTRVLAAWSAVAAAPAATAAVLLLSRYCFAADDVLAPGGRCRSYMEKLDSPVIPW